jgi:hypothetical protein
VNQNSHLYFSKVQQEANLESQGEIVKVFHGQITSKWKLHSLGSGLSRQKALAWVEGAAQW